MRSDLAGPRLVTLIDLCRALAESFDGEYTQRVGVPLSGPAAGTLVLFASRRRFRDYVAADAGLPQGYAGFSVPWAGLVALPVGDIADAEVARTLSHELAHLAHRRAFGRDLPPWLSEGLADAIGDSATPQGYRPLADLTVVDGIRKRLRAAAGSGRVGSIERLVALDGERFDRALPSYDYEQAALLVRFLLLDRELAPRFRRWLREWAARGARAAPTLDAGLGRSWSEIEDRFGAWLQGP
jgi:hypothetical protein